MTMKSKKPKKPKSIRDLIKTELYTQLAEAALGFQNKGGQVFVSVFAEPRIIIGERLLEIRSISGASNFRRSYSSRTFLFGAVPEDPNYNITETVARVVKFCKLLAEADDLADGDE